MFRDVAASAAVLTILHAHINISWIAFDAAGNFDQSERFTGVVRWDFGKRQCTPRTGS